MNRFALKISEDILDMLEQLNDGEPVTVFDGTPYAIATFISSTEIHLKFMTEEEMFAEFKNDNNLHILS